MPSLQFSLSRQLHARGDQADPPTPTFKSAVSIATIPHRNTIHIIGHHGYVSAPLPSSFIDAQFNSILFLRMLQRTTRLTQRQGELRQHPPGLVPGTGQVQVRRERSGLEARGRRRHLHSRPEQHWRRTMEQGRPGLRGEDPAAEFGRHPARRLPTRGKDGASRCDAAAADTGLGL